MLIISPENSIIFKLRNNLRKNFDNTLSFEETETNSVNIPFCQKWDQVNTVKVQVQTDEPTTSTEIIVLDDDGSQLAVTLIKTVSGLFFYEFDVVMAARDSFYLTVEQGTVKYRSEWQKVTDTENLVRFDYFNYENTEVYYLPDDFQNQIAFFFYVDGIVKDYTPSGEREVIDDQEEKENIYEEIYRNLALKTNYISKSLAEKIKIASSLDVFVVNDAQFIKTDDIEVVPNNSNLVSVNAVFVQKGIIGLNTHDTGFDCSAVIINDDYMLIELDNVSGNQSGVISAKYMLQNIAVFWKAGTDVKVRASTDPTFVDEDKEFMGYEVVDSTAAGSVINVQIGIVFSKVSNTNVYFEITGTGASVDIRVRSEVIST
jgi:hypothetical protein